jgi:gamma-glutamyltranspeptidase/glutathione hydrolase
MWMFNPLPGYRNSVAPGRPPISGTSAFMFLQGGRPLLALSSPGGSRGTASCIQAACNILEFGLEPQAAVSAGRIFAEDRHGVVRVDDGIPMETRAALVAMGKRLEVGRNGIVSASYRDPASGELVGGADPRSGAGIAVVEKD